MVKIIAVVGGKHSGKTTIITQLIRELRRRGYRVGSVKEMLNVQLLDVPGKETWKYAIAGAEIVVGAAKEETVFFIKRKLSLNEIISFFQEFDYLILEGFDAERNVTKIVAAKDMDEILKFYDDRTIAISGIVGSKEKRITTSLKLPIIDCLSEVDKLADIIERKTF